MTLPPLSIGSLSPSSDLLRVLLHQSFLVRVRCPDEGLWSLPARDREFVLRLLLLLRWNSKVIRIIQATVIHHLLKAKDLTKEFSARCHVVELSEFRCLINL